MRTDKVSSGGLSSVVTRTLTLMRFPALTSDGDAVINTDDVATVVGPSTSASACISRDGASIRIDNPDTTTPTNTTIATERQTDVRCLM